MHLKDGSKVIFWVVSILIITGVASFLNSLDSGSYRTDSRSSEIFGLVSNDKKVTVKVLLKDFDPISQTLIARIWILPPNNYATDLFSSVQLKYDTKIDISASIIKYNGSDKKGEWKKGEYLRAIDIELDADNYEIRSLDHDQWFPFDSYSFYLTGTVEFRTEGGGTRTTDDDIWEVLPVEVLPYTANLSGWSATFKSTETEDATTQETFMNGRTFASDIILKRTSLNRALTFLIGLIFIGGGLSMLLLFRSILMNHRPPTLSGLIWAGSTAFTMIQTRNIIPGEPRIGVKFDLFIFYPSLILCFLSGGLMFYYWITKETWSREL